MRSMFSLGHPNAPLKDYHFRSSTAGKKKDFAAGPNANN